MFTGIIHKNTHNGISLPKFKKRNLHWKSPIHKSQDLLSASYPFWYSLSLNCVTAPNYLIQTLSVKVGLYDFKILLVNGKLSHYRKHDNPNCLIEPKRDILFLV